MALLVPGSAAAQAPVDGVGFPQRLTQIGADGNTAFGAFDPGVAYNTLQDEFLVVWQGIDPSAPTETEIYGRLLDGVGAPKGPVHRLSEVPGTNPAGQPVVGYSPVVNQYLLAYTGFPPAAVPPPANNPAGQVEILGQVVTTNGVRSGNPVRISNTDPTNADADQATDPAMAYDPERDQFRIVWRADETEADFEISTRRVSSSLIDPGGFTVVPISTTAAGTADDPVIAHLPDQDRYAIAWESNVPAASFISREVIGVGANTIADDAQISGGLNSAAQASITANPAAGEFLVGFANDLAGEGFEAFAQRLSSEGVQIPNATDSRISTMGPPGATAYDVSATVNTTAGFHPLMGRYLVTWASDHDLPGLVDNELERYGQALDGAGTEVPNFDFRISFAGPDGSTAAAPLDASLAASTARRGWLQVWEGDDNRPPLADNEFEIYGRFIGDDFDLDGFAVPVDCNDANPGINPFATDIPDNGIDEDCGGGDSINFDRDGDGSRRPADCNDNNPFIRPGRRDIPGNRIDEDCSGRDTPVLTRAGVEAEFQVFGSITRVTRLVVKRAKRRMRIRIRCVGPGCPNRLRRTKRIRVRRAGTRKLTGLVGGASLRPGAKLTVQLIESGAVGRSVVFRMRNAKAPTRRESCLRPGTTRTRRCPR